MHPMREIQAETQLVIDRAAHTILLTRTFAAPRRQVFEAWTRPEHVACWWDPTGAPLAECAIDLVPGGAFQFVAEGSKHSFSGTYREIAPPEQLVFEAMGSIGKVVFEQMGDDTLLTVSIECRSAAQLDEFIAMGVDVGTSQTLDNLVAYVRDLRQ